MPVLVAAADLPLGRRIAQRLLAEGGEVRAYAAGDGDLAALRGAGAFIAVGDPDDEGRLEAAMADVHTVVHVVDVLLAPGVESLATALGTLATAAANAQVRRVIVSSLPGAGPEAGDDLRRALGRAEAALAAARVPSVVIRPSLLDTPALRDALAASSLPDAVRSRTVAPVRPADLVELVVAFDAMRSRAAEGHAVFAADGAERMSLGRYVETVGVAGGSLVGRRYPRPADHPLLARALAGEWLAGDGGVPDAWAFAGLRPEPVETAGS